MKNSFLKPTAQNKASRTLFYIFEIAAVCVCFVMFIMAIVDAATFGGFGVFIGEFVTAVVYGLILFGIGKVIDLLSAINEVGTTDDNEKTK